MTPRRNLTWTVVPLLALCSAGFLLARSNPVIAQSSAPQAPIFEVDPFWPKPLPNHWVTGSTIGLSVDRQDRVWTIHRPNTVEDNFKAADIKVGDARGKDDEALPGRGGDAATGAFIGKCCKVAPPVLVYDQAGDLVKSWGGPGKGYDWPDSNHGITVDHDGNVWLAGNGEKDTQLLKFDGAGQFLFQIGKHGVHNGSNDVGNFWKPTKVFVEASTNEVYVADGYGNRRVIVFDAASGKYKRHWGAYGNQPSDDAVPAYSPTGPRSKQFNTVHCAMVSADGFVYVCDRVNDRIQVFRKDGTFVKEAVIDAHTFRSGSVWDLTFSRDPQQTYIYAANGVDQKISILLRSTLEVLTSFGDGGRGPGQFFGVHNLATDSHGNLYTAETYTGARVQRFIYKGIGPVTRAEQGVVRRGQQDRPTVFDGARILDGNGGPPIENGRLVIQDTRVVAAGPQSTVSVPSGATRIDATGKTIMPAMINVHAHVGYEGYTTWGARNHTAENVLDHMQREAFYGVAAVTSVGSSPTAMSLQFQRDQQAAKFPPAARYLFMPGMAPPNGGPDHILREATNELGVINEVTTPAQARDAIQKMADQQIRHVKMWVDDRGGTYPKLTPDVYTAIVREAHARNMTVHAHAIQLADQKAVVAAGADVLVHMVQREAIDAEFRALLREKQPYWATVISLGDAVEVCKPDPFFEDALPRSLVTKIRATTERLSLQAQCAAPSANAATREKILAQNFPLMIDAGAKLVLATDTGIHPGHTFGSGEHVELARWVQLGLPPAQAIVAATRTPAQLMGLTDLGTLTPGKRASFIVLDANPLDDIHNTRRIADVYLDGVKFDREAVRSKWRSQR